MNQDKYKSVREAIIKANPFRHEPWEYDTGEPVGSGYIKHNPCRLADVVLATMKNKDGCTKKELADILLQFAYLWDCLQDSLEDQSPETIEFLYELLAAEKKLNPS